MPNNNQMISRVVRKLKFISLQSRIKSYDEFKKIKPFDQLDSNLIEVNKNILRPYYVHYAKEISSADMAASLELAAFMLTLCKLNKYTKLLDMGSGLSSFVFRLYAKDNPGVVVYSVDDDAAWLDKTKQYLQQNRLDISNVFTLDQFMKLGESGFDCILHDLNFVEVRINYLDHMMQILNKNGILILDDVHKPDYRFLSLCRLKKFNAKVYTAKPVTYDSFGRYSLLAIKK
jgi:predicted O-methyltransferase YrrM